MEQRIQEYPTSLVQDKRLLENCEDQNLKNVLILRKGEKEVLTFYETMSRKMVRWLSSGRGDVSMYRSYV